MQNHENEIDLLELFNKLIFVLRRTKYIFILVFILSMTACVKYVEHTYVPFYESQVTFAVSRELNGETTYQYNKKATDELATSFSSIVSSDVMKDAMLKDLGMDKLPATLEAKRVGTTNLFTVVASGTDAKGASDVIRVFLDNYARVFRITLLDINLEMIEKPGKEAKLSNQPGYINLCAKAALVLVAIYLALIVIYILLRKTIAEEEDVKHWLRMTCLGITPYVKIIGKKKYPLISADGSRYFDLKDSVGSIRRHLEKDAKKNEHKSYLFTGAVEGEGTTTTDAN